MRSRLPQGVYLGCTSNQIAEPGRIVWVTVPGVRGSLRAIVGNKIDSLTNLTLTVDQNGIARIFGVGEKAPTLDRTTDWLRVRRREPIEDEPIRWAILLERVIRTPLPVGSGNVYRKQVQEWIWQGKEPLLTLDIAYDLPADYGLVVLQLLSIDSNGLVSADFKRQNLASPDLIAEAFHYQINGSSVLAVPAGTSWRAPFVNELDYFNRPPEDGTNPCIWTYRSNPYVNVDPVRQKVYSLANPFAVFWESLAAPQTLTVNSGDFLVDPDEPNICQTVVQLDYSIDVPAMAPEYIAMLEAVPEGSAVGTFTIVSVIGIVAIGA